MLSKVKRSIAMVLWQDYAVICRSIGYATMTERPTTDRRKAYWLNTNRPNTQPPPHGQYNRSCQLFQLHKSSIVLSCQLCSFRNHVPYNYISKVVTVLCALSVMSQFKTAVVLIIYVAYARTANGTSTTLSMAHRVWVREYRITALHRITGRSYRPNTNGAHG